MIFSISAGEKIPFRWDADFLHDHNNNFYQIPHEYTKAENWQHYEDNVWMFSVDNAGQKQ